MLLNLSISNVALIEKADITFGNGFNVLTGETGAGKSILIGSVNMLLGERVSRDIIRNGENYAQVEGLFYPSADMCKQLETYGVLTDEDGALIVSRKLFLDGKNVCKVGEMTVPVAKLREIGRVLINIHGQHDNQALLDSTTHISFLDAYASQKEKECLLEYQETYSSLKEHEKLLEEMNIDETERLRRIDILRYEIDEISSAAIYEGEEELLKEQRNLAKNKESIQKGCSLALDVLYENSDGICVYNLLSEAQRAVDAAELTGAGLENASDKISEILYGLEDVIGAVRNKLEQVETDNISLEEIEERLDVLYRLKRKYGNSETEILEYCKRAEEELMMMQSSDAKKSELSDSVKRLTEKANRLAETIHAMRIKIAEPLKNRSIMS